MLSVACMLSIFFLVLGLEDLLWGPTAKNINLRRLYDIADNKKLSKRKFGYHIRDGNYIKYSLIGCTSLFMLCIIFTRSLGLSCVFSLLGFYYPKYILKRNINKNRELLTMQFKEAMFSISNSMRAGSSLENALFRCLKEMRQLYKMHVDKPIINELEQITYELKMGNSLRKVLIDFKERTEIEDISSFVSAAIITEDKGGNLSEVINNVSKMISDRITLKREIKTLTAGKQAENRLLTLMPLAIITVLSLIAPSYMAPMYEHSLGKLMIIIGIFLILINYIVGKKIIHIDV